MAATEPVASLIFLVPYPVTTTSFKLEPAAATNETFTEDLPSIETSCVSNPIEVITSVVTFEPTLILNVPSAFVEVPVLVPFG